MGVFPQQRRAAEALILYGGLTARLGGATKVISKSYQEAFGIPTPEANARGIQVAALAGHDFLDFVRIDEALAEEEAHWIQREVAELIEPVLDSLDLITGIERAFAEGRLDIPFSASVHAWSEVTPARDASGAIRLVRPGNLPLSAAALKRNLTLANRVGGTERFIESITADINYFLRQETAS
jgi:methylaspartate mutase epsilon subunit